ncbi:MAG: EpsI domain-containing exosortase [Alteromonadaceae bacterium]|nr:EpsI domain-containing exosortase [Alteromonadaceae bacterium]MBH87344.1 EpsI domain-containing exosortase [Alteromonadaceae bacterium]|tara:strand:- start:25243 stop:26796 length:1554 start_codon:yes stop_codon:yes gene_type:complete
MDRTSVRRSSDLYLPLLIVLAFVVSTLPAWIGVGERWLKFDEAYSHGFLLLGLTVYLSASTWLSTKPRCGFHWPWLIPLALGLLVYLAGSLLLVEALQQVVLVPVLILSLLSIWGWRQGLPFIVPIGLIVFAIPFWDYLSWTLQVITVTMNQLLLAPLDIEFFVEGVFVYFPGVGAFEIADGCSGLRYLLVGLTMTVMYGELNLRLWRHRFILIICGVLVALVANWLRVFIIIYQGYTTDMTSSLVNEHDFFGWCVFAVALVPLYFIARFFENREDRIIQGGPSGVRNVTDAAGPSVFGAGLTLILLLGVGGLAYGIVPPAEKGAREGVRPHEIKLLDRERWLPIFEKTLDNWRPELQNPDRILERSFVERSGVQEQSNAAKLWVGLYSFDYQRPGSELVFYKNRLYDADAFVPERTFQVDTGDGVVLGGLTLRHRRTEDRIHVAYGYYVEGQWEMDGLRAKLAQLPGIFNARSDASLLVFGVHCEHCDAENVLRSQAFALRRTSQEYLDQLYAPSQ